jgi:hypothetical protein
MTKRFGQCFPFQGALLARMTPLLAPLLILSCSSNPKPRVLPELLARKPACLTLDWGAGPRATFYGQPAPDTLMLLPDRGEPLGYVDSADAWGRIELASSQQDRSGGGWASAILGVGKLEAPGSLAGHPQIAPPFPPGAAHRRAQPTRWAQPPAAPPAQLDLLMLRRDSP